MMGVYNTLQDTFHELHGWEKGSSKAKLMDGLITSCLPIGCMIGSIFSGIITSRLGRYKTLILLDSIAIISIAVTLFDSIPIIIAGRTITGIAVGINSTTVPIYINEMSPGKISGKMVFNLFSNKL